MGVNINNISDGSPRIPLIEAGTDSGCWDITELAVMTADPLLRLLFRNGYLQADELLSTGCDRQSPLDAQMSRVEWASLMGREVTLADQLDPTFTS